MAQPALESALNRIVADLRSRFERPNCLLYGGQVTDKQTEVAMRHENELQLSCESWWLLHIEVYTLTIQNYTTLG